VNYTTLAAAIRSYTENIFPSTLDTAGLSSDAQINTFIQQAEERIFNTVQLLELRKNVTSTCTAFSPYVTAPTDWLSTFSLAAIDPVTNAYTFLLNKDENFIRTAYPNPNSYGPPRHYAYFDQNSFILGPTPDVTYALELHYFYYPPSIVTTGTSWLGDNFDSVLLYGSLLEASTFMKDEADIITNYQKRYDDALATLKQFAEGKNRQDNYRTPQTRYPVK